MYTLTETDKSDMIGRMFLRGPKLNPISFKSLSVRVLKADPFIFSSASNYVSAK